MLIAKPDHLLLDNIAVRPDRQGTGLGRVLIAFAEQDATRRGREHGYDRVFMTKHLG